MWNPLVQRLSTNGDGTGTTNAVADYSTTAGVFYLSDADQEIRVHRLIGYIRDTGAFDAEGYGAGAELTNGITLTVTNAADVVQHTLTTEPVKNNGEWSALCYDTMVATWGVGDEFLTFRYSFNKFTEHGLVLAPGDKFVATFNDSHTVLISHLLTVEGEKADN